MDTDLVMWDWQWEYKHRGTINYECRTQHREFLLKERTLVTPDPPVKAQPDRGYFHNKNTSRGKNSLGIHASKDISKYEFFKKPRTITKERIVTVYTVPENRQIRWSRRGRKGYFALKEEEEYYSDEVEENESDTEELQTCERWPPPVPRKGGCPYIKIRRYSFPDKNAISKTLKRNNWRKQCEQEISEVVVKKKKMESIDPKLAMIDAKKHAIMISLFGKQNSQANVNKDFDRTITERRLKRKNNNNAEVIPPFIGDNLGPSDIVIQKPIAFANDLVVKEHKGSEHGDTVEVQRERTVYKVAVTDQESNGSLLIKLLRESTRPDTLNTEFRHDYKEAACKPRRFVINISRIVLHHVTLINRLRLRIIPKLDLTTYLVFSYCKEWATGVDLFRVHVASTWVKSAKNILANLHSKPSGHITQVQELIQCVIGALDSVDIHHLVARENRKTKKENYLYYRPTCNFSMLRSVIKWEFYNANLPRAIEWYSKEQPDEKTHLLCNIDGLRHIFEFCSCSESSGDVKRGPSEPQICGGCLLQTTPDGANKLMALDACNHWFCEQCWKSRLLRQIKEADVSQKGVAQCVEKDCDNLVDPISLLTLLSVQKIRSTIESRIRSHVGKLSASIFICPKENCRQIFSLLEKEKSSPSGMAFPIVCRCSHHFCSKCLNSPHWPLTCEHSTNYAEFTNQRKDNNLFFKFLLDHELPDDLLSGKRCFNCGRFVRQFVFRKTESNEFERPVCLQCVKGDNRNINLPYISLLNSDHSRNSPANECAESKITKWYKIASTHRKMKHPEVVKALYGMAGIVADKLAIAVSAGKYIGDAKKAAVEWDDKLLEWADENFADLCKSQVKPPYEGDSLSSLEKQPLLYSTETSTRATSASSNHSYVNSLALSETILSSDFNTFSKFSTLARDGNFSLDTKRAAYNIVHLKLELHAIAEYVAVLLDYQVVFRNRLIRYLERAEDLCFSLGILLQDPHVHNAPRILPTFMRLRLQAKQAIENINNEIKSAKVDKKLD